MSDAASGEYKKTNAELRVEWKMSKSMMSFTMWKHQRNVAAGLTAERGD